MSNLILQYHSTGRFHLAGTVYEAPQQFDGLRVEYRNSQVYFYDTVNESFWYKNWQTRLALAKKTNNKYLKSVLSRFTPEVINDDGFLIIKIANSFYSVYGEPYTNELVDARTVDLDQMIWLKPKQYITTRPSNALVKDGHLEFINGCVQQIQVKVKDGLMTVNCADGLQVCYDTVNEPYWYKDNFSKLILADKMEEEGKQELANSLRESCS
jgi:hypothetical protein